MSTLIKLRKFCSINSFLQFYLSEENINLYWTFCIYGDSLIMFLLCSFMQCIILFDIWIKFWTNPTFWAHTKKKNTCKQNNLVLITKSCPIFEPACTGACQTPLSIAFSRQEYWSSVAISQSRDQTQVSCTAGRFFYQLSYQGRSWYISGSFLYTVGFSFLIFF